MAQISSYVDPDLGQALINNIEVEVDNNISPDAPTPEEETEILKDIAEATPDDSVIAEIAQKDGKTVTETPTETVEEPKVFSAAMNNKKNKKNKK